MMENFSRNLVIHSIRSRLKLAVFTPLCEECDYLPTQFGLKKVKTLRILKDLSISIARIQKEIFYHGLDQIDSTENSLKDIKH